MNRANVPCAGCRLCCINELVILQPEDGTDYATLPVRTPLTGEPALMLAHKDNGECVYLGKTGCTIHDRAPVMCRVYDCRRQYQRMSRAGRRAAVARGVMTKDKLDAGRARLHTLEG